MSRKLIVVAAWVSGISAAAGCVPYWVGNDMQERIAELEDEQQTTEKQLKRQRDKLENKIKEANAEVEELREVLKKAKKLLQRNNADLGAELQETRTEIQKVRGEIERTQFRLRKLRQELEMFKEDVEMRFAGGAGGATGKMPKKADELWKFAKKKMDEGNLRAARRALSTFKSKFSDDERVPKAQLYLGDIHFDQGKWVSAVVSYRKVVQQYSDSAHVPEATYKIGVAFIKLGKCEDAKPFFETVVAEHGGTRWAKNAQQKLEELKGGSCP